MDNNRNRATDHLGINKISKSIRKSPLHQPTFSNPRQQQQQQLQGQRQGSGGGGNQQPPQPQPQVYNINKNDFRSVVQQLTGTPTRDPSPSSNTPPPPRPAIHNPQKLTSMRLQKIRPPPLTPIARSPIPHPQPHVANPIPNPGFYHLPGHPPPATAPIQSPAIPFSPLLPPTPPPGNALWGNTLESPISAYMRYLESSIVNHDGSHPAAAQRMSAQSLPQALRPPPGQMQQMPPVLAAYQPLPPTQQDQLQATATGLLPNPHVAHPIPSPRGLASPPFGPSAGLLPSPTSQFVLPSPSAFLNLLSPRSPFPLLSPKFQYPPLSPNFAFSPMAGQSGILGPGPQPSPSPHMFPPSPSGFLPIMSPRWRDL
ncbi:hypothetical protein Taro_044153 [Colocasia esculenta]|uniref:VQ domain-containing protein n=1 Tax=Colocasia esculenta TaxID=4460 RepID=A0A843WMZ8_COLES|nr:hypothetical protein [Colocasia esculenta]